jgi:antitoxin component YwqK of YwqJK toxin-antitoxin module
MKWVLGVSILIVFTSCGDDQEIVYSYHEDGSVSSMTETKSGLKDGYYKFYYENGNVEEQGIYSNDKRQGLVRKFYLDGSIKQELLYVQGTLIEQNDYWYNGKVRSLLYYNNNKVVDFLFYDSLGSRDLSWELVRPLFDSVTDTVKI